MAPSETHGGDPKDVMLSLISVKPSIYFLKQAPEKVL